MIHELRFHFLLHLLADTCGSSDAFVLKHLFFLKLKNALYRNTGEVVSRL